MTISTERLQEMLAAAEKATPGPWQLLNVGDGRRAKAPADEVGISLLTIVSEGEVDFAAVYEDADAAHIDNCDPDTIRELITELLASRSGVGCRRTDSELPGGKEQAEGGSAALRLSVIEECAKVADGVGEAYGMDETGWIDCSETIAMQIRTLKDNTHGA